MTIRVEASGERRKPTMSTVPCKSIRPPFAFFFCTFLPHNQEFKKIILGFTSLYLQNNFEYFILFLLWSKQQITTITENVSMQNISPSLKTWSGLHV